MGHVFFFHIEATGPHSRKDIADMLKGVALRKGARFEVVEVERPQLELYHELKSRYGDSGVPAYMLGIPDRGPRLRLVQ
ncbi:hypothetical protein D3C80_1508760 [compost metagenome]